MIKATIYTVVTDASKYNHQFDLYVKAVTSTDCCRSRPEFIVFDCKLDTKNVNGFHFQHKISKKKFLIFWRKMTLFSLLTLLLNNKCLKFNFIILFYSFVPSLICLFVYIRLYLYNNFICLIIISFCFISFIIYLIIFILFPLFSYAV